MEDEVYCRQSQEEEEEPQFYDARDDISSSSEPSSSSPLPFQLSIHALDLQSGFFGGKLDSVEERRQRFMAWMLSNSMFSPRADLRIFLKEDEIVKSGEMSTSGDTPRGLQQIGVVERKHRHILDVARTFLFEKGFPHSEKSGEMIESSDSSVSEHRRITDPGNEKVLITNSRTNSEEVPIIRREDNLSTSSRESTKWRRNKWLRRFGIAACIMDGEKEEDSEISSSSKDLFSKNQIHRVKVRLYRKPSKEFSGVFSSQEIRAHKGAILVMKFSPDGRFLATGGEDGVVRVWSMMTHQRNFEDDLLSLYLSPNNKSDPSPIYIEKDEKLRSWKIMRRNQDSACIVIPPDICRISEEPIQEFVGHSGEILDLCWSKNNVGTFSQLRFCYKGKLLNGEGCQFQVLLSSSMDKTARVWQVGSDSPGKIFSHGNYGDYLYTLKMPSFSSHTLCVSVFTYLLFNFPPARSPSLLFCLYNDSCFLSLSHSLWFSSPSLLSIHLSIYPILLPYLSYSSYKIYSSVDQPIHLSFVILVNLSLFSLSLSINISFSRALCLSLTFSVYNLLSNRSTHSSTIHLFIVLLVDLSRYI